MNRLIRGSGRAVLFTLILCCTAGGRLYADADYSIYEDIIEKYNIDGFFDYSGFVESEDKEKLERFLSAAGDIALSSLTSGETQALLVNLYNANVLSLIAENYPVASIMDIRNPFTRKFCSVDGDTYSLDEIEKELLLKNFPDARFHFVLNCAARSCAPLPKTVLRKSNIDTLLSQAASKFINNPEYNEFVIEKRRKGLKREDFLSARVSTLFSWYEGDFINQYGSMRGVLLVYLENPPAADLLRSDRYEIEFLPYDWTLNDASR